MTADVCVLVESTYPYASGGVSVWLHSLISKLPEIRFSIAHLGGQPEPGRVPYFKLPENVVEYTELHLFDASWAKRLYRASRTTPHKAATWERLSAFHAGLNQGQPSGDTDILRMLCQQEADAITAHDLIFAPESWKLLLAEYERRAPSSSFIDYFWTFRTTHLPLFSLLQSQLPRARVYHAVSSGFNGFTGALAKLRTGAPLILTEHGISTREREIEIAQSEWIYREESGLDDPGQRFGHFQEWWLDMFRFMTRVTYDYADAIISITSFNQRYQLRDGADPRKMMIIPNGIDVESYRVAPARVSGEGEDDRFVIGFVGRVVSIKDVKTYIRAVHFASQVIPRLFAYVVGPTTEEPEYVEECQRLADRLGLSGILQFVGPADVRDYYRKMDVLVLTSLSEAQPLVILEANCAGVPVVATEVGACRELLMGGTPEDEAIGQSGLITPPVSPRETAQAIIQLWRDAETRTRMARAGLERAQRFYQHAALYEAYRAVYGRFLAVSPVEAE